MPLGKEVGLGPGHIVLDCSPPQQLLPTFGPCLLWPNGRPSQQLLGSCLYWRVTALCSGTTLLQHTVWLVLNDGVATRDGKALTDRVPYIDPDPATTEMAAQLQSPRLLKTHMPYGCLPAPVEAGRGKVNTIG